MVKKKNKKGYVHYNYSHAPGGVLLSKNIDEKLKKIRKIFRKHGYTHISFWEDGYGIKIHGYKGKSTIMKGRYEVIYNLRTRSLYLTDWDGERDRHRKNVSINQIDRILSSWERSFNCKRKNKKRKK